MRVGVLITASESPPNVNNPFNTASAFMAGYGDTGVVGSAVKCLSIGQVASVVGARSATNEELYDSADVYFREQGSVLYISRIVGTTPVNSTLTLNDGNAKPSIAIVSKYPGSAPNQYDVTVTNGTSATFTATTASTTALTAISSCANIGPGTLITGTGISADTYIVSVNTTAGTAVLSQAATASSSGVTMTPGTFTVTMTDLTGQFATETHGPYINTAALYADLTSQMVTFTQSAASMFTINSPAVLSATALTGGTDNRSTVNLTTVGNALAAFTPALGPGQVSAPGFTNTTLNGIWSLLDTHANANNRIALKDADDGQLAATIITDVGSYGTAATAAWGELHAGQVQAPGVTYGTNRLIPASAVVSALCAQVDATGNPNQAPAGPNFPLGYCIGFSGVNGAPLYGQSDIDALNAAGINTWNTVFGVLQNYGAVTPVPQTSDPVYWRLPSARLRMAVTAAFQVVAQPFMFSNLDGQGLDIVAFSGDLAAKMSNFVTAKAISTLAPDGTQDQGFVVDTSPNTPTTMGAGQLLANVSYRPAPFAQLIEIQLIAVPTTASL